MHGHEGKNAGGGGRRQDVPVRQAFGLRLPRPGDPALRDLRARHVPHHQGHRPWNAGWLLISYLERVPLQDLHVLDLGCGWGLASVYCARRGARVTATDIDPQVFPYLHMLAAMNQVEISCTQAGFDAIDTAMLSGVDLLIGADICFRAPMVAGLLGVLRRGCAAGTAAVITDPGRIPYRDLAARCVADLDAREQAWRAAEPLLAWPGCRPTIEGRLLRLGSLRLPALP